MLEFEAWRRCDCRACLARNDLCRQRPFAREDWIIAECPRRYFSLFLYSCDNFFIIYLNIERLVHSNLVGVKARGNRTLCAQGRLQRALQAAWCPRLGSSIHADFAGQALNHVEIVDITQIQGRMDRNAVQRHLCEALGVLA